MVKKLLSYLQPWLKTLFLIALVLTFTLAQPGNADAARSGGRIGGGSFRSTPSRTYSAPRSDYGGSGYYRSPGGFGGGFGFPFLLPFFGFGGGFGSLFTILIFFAVANFLINTFRRNSLEGGNDGAVLGSGKVSVAKVQVGLLAQARELQGDLDRLARTADTGTPEGRAKVIQEASLALLRHPEYWVYGVTESSSLARDSAEAKFNQLSLGERSKFTAETLSNVDNQLKTDMVALPSVAEDLAKQIRQEAGEYIIITLLVGAEGKLDLPTINDSSDLEQALRMIGGVGSDRLLAIEILWTPQASGDTLTTDDILAAYPNLKLV